MNARDARYRKDVIGHSVARSVMNGLLTETALCLSESATWRLERPRLSVKMSMVNRFEELTSYR